MMRFTAVSIALAVLVMQPCSAQILLAVTPSAGGRPAAMHSILAFAVNGAQRQLRDLGKAPEIVRQVFDYCQVPPRDKLEPIYGGRSVFECQDSWPGAFKGRADLAKAVRDASPVGFTQTVPCPKDYDGWTFFACLRSSNGTEVHLVEGDHFPDLGYSYSMFVLAPPLSQGARANVRVNAATMLRGLFQDMTAIAAHSFGEADGVRFAAQHAALLNGCEVRRPPTGRPVLDCELRVFRSLTKPDLTAAVHASLPKGFRRSKCVELSSLYAELSPVCERNSSAVEVRFGEGLHIEADDTSYPASATATMRQFFTIALAAAAGNFQGFDSKKELPYFGRCRVVQKSPTVPQYLACEPDGEATDFDLLAVVRRALPPGYAATNACTLYNWPFLRPDEAVVGCFGAGSRPEIDVAEYQSNWYVNIGLPNPR